MKTMCNRVGCSTSFDSDGRRWYCSRACQLAVWRGRARARAELARPAPGERRNRITSGYSDDELWDLELLADDDGVTVAELQRSIVVRYLSEELT